MPCQPILIASDGATPVSRAWIEPDYVSADIDRFGRRHVLAQIVEISRLFVSADIDRFGRRHVPVAELPVQDLKCQPILIASAGATAACVSGPDVDDVSADIDRFGRRHPARDPAGGLHRGRVSRY